MLRSLVRRILALALVGVVGLGGGGMPVLDGLVFHGPERVAEAFRPHLEAASTCHGDGCSVRALAQARFMPDGGPQDPVITPIELVPETPPRVILPPALPASLHLSRAPPLSA